MSELPNVIYAMPDGTWKWTHSRSPEKAEQETEYIRASTASPLSDEQRQLLELVELMQGELPEFDASAAHRFGLVVFKDSVLAYEDGKYLNVPAAITDLRKRLEPDTAFDRRIAETADEFARAVARAVAPELVPEPYYGLDDWDLQN